jgi:hypothetical protein
MSEHVPGYTPDRFPYSAILSDMTGWVEQHSIGPVEAYAGFLDERERRGLSPYFDYASTSITTGGHARYMDDTAGVIAANTRTARQMVELLDDQGTITGRRMILPVDLGKTGWSQSEFMTFWALTISGPDLRDLPNDIQGLTTFEDDLDQQLRNHGVDLSVMDSHLGREERNPHYIRFIDAYVGAMQNTGVRCLPAYRMVSLVDPEISLGCSAEMRLARELGIPVNRVVPVKPATVEEAVPVPTLKQDMNVITAAGGVVCVAARGSMLTLLGQNRNAD